MTFDDATRALTTLANGDSRGAETLMPLVYDELHRLASHFMRGQSPSHTLQATALVNEAFLKLIGARANRWQDEAHFRAVAARAMRQILVNHAAGQNALKRGGDRRRVSLEAEELPGAARDDSGIIEIHELLETLAGLDERKARVAEMKLFAGATTQGIAHVLDVSLSTVEADWRFARAWLATELGETDGA
ncbi:MAG: sigma-70 family RNA polymerase sigma factor [Phycisphaerales bacterium]|nr:sigma-70 family RNA polymerase sigma factor [Phycisphaerales bacterium]